MNLFSERKKLEEQYKQWLKNNPNVMDCAFSVITFLDLQDRLKNNGEISISDKIKIKKLADYENAEEQGLLLRLPCPIGTTVFVVVEEYEEMYEPDSTYFEIYSESFHPYMLDDIGKYVFLTEEEAEAALKKMQEGEE